MKKAIGFLSLLLLFLALFGCDNRQITTNASKISTPVELEINEKNGYLTWREVDGALGYIVSINGEEQEVIKNQQWVDFSLFIDKTISIRVKSLSNNPNILDSDYSQEINKEVKNTKSDKEVLDLLEMKEINEENAKKVLTLSKKNAISNNLVYEFFSDSFNQGIKHAWEEGKLSQIILLFSDTGFMTNDAVSFLIDVSSLIQWDKGLSIDYETKMKIDLFLKEWKEVVVSSMGSMMDGLFYLRRNSCGEAIDTLRLMFSYECPFSTNELTLIKSQLSRYLIEITPSVEEINRLKKLISAIDSSFREEIDQNKLCSSVKVKTFLTNLVDLLEKTIQLNKGFLEEIDEDFIQKMGQYNNEFSTSSTHKNENELQLRFISLLIEASTAFLKKTENKTLLDEISVILNDNKEITSLVFTSKIQKIFPFLSESEIENIDFSKSNTVLKKILINLAQSECIKEGLQQFFIPKVGQKDWDLNSTSSLKASLLLINESLDNLNQEEFEVLIEPFQNELIDWINKYVEIQLPNSVTKKELTLLLKSLLVSYKEIGQEISITSRFNEFDNYANALRKSYLEQALLVKQQENYQTIKRILSDMEIKNSNQELLSDKEIEEMASMLLDLPMESMIDFLVPFYQK